MPLATNLFRIIILILGIIVLSFDVLLYNAFEHQKMQVEAVSKQQQVEEQVNSNKFKYQQDQITSLGKNLEEAQQQIKIQAKNLASQQEENKDVQTFLVDVKAQADAVKQGMKDWQKEYVSVLAELEKKMDDFQNEIKSLSNVPAPALGNDVKDSNENQL